jgi:hypothetical protein
VSSTNNAARPDHREQPTYWFALLEIARERGDHAAAAEAQRELERLGVRVRYARPRRRREAEPCPS